LYDSEKDKKEGQEKACIGPVKGGKKTLNNRRHIRFLFNGLMMDI
jgi:hypothetical protein